MGSFAFPTGRADINQNIKTQKTDSPTNVTVTAINGTRTRPIGYVTLDVMIVKHVLQVRFYVMPASTMEEHVILGCTWCYLTNC